MKKSEIDRAIILIYNSNNAHDYINFMRAGDWLDDLPMRGLNELSSMLTVIEKEVQAEIDRKTAIGETRYSTNFYRQCNEQMKQQGKH